MQTDFIQGRSDRGFSRAFLPGLVLGVIVGGFAGAILPEFMPRSAGAHLVSLETARPASHAERARECVSGPEIALETSTNADDCGLRSENRR